MAILIPFFQMDGRSLGCKKQKIIIQLRLANILEQTFQDIRKKESPVRTGLSNR
ncbi:hypothetical protein [Pedobacter psychrotolerans]|uniref:hypothetical protein n=1 Tax=Pedobacter psychrotolerans TaxID=1843235 RepID=UPI001665AF20|nr:hypothetical protein [Pedobacter psychrotolerans]